VQCFNAVRPKYRIFKFYLSNFSCFIWFRILRCRSVIDEATFSILADPYLFRTAVNLPPSQKVVLSSNHANFPAKRATDSRLNEQD
jgi:hypothetical protein